ncbi:YndJ family protein [Piscibacillus salipiscarius]|uniref:YndJ family protein n=1 Tax=Piscibacillus salipiscarius TaxID=299480 RepID=UPI0006D29B7E|nr:YndJ family protein [Piscibacillus salipiscarius]
MYTILIAFKGFNRFLHRGFTHIEEILIDVAMVFLAIGGIWFLAYEAGINTGFSPIITWLTAIHFHYAGFLLPIFTGLLGRLGKPKLYKWAAWSVIVAIVLVALGITFSTTLELLSVLVYIFAIYSLIGLTFFIKFIGPAQKWLFRITFIAIGVSIIFSLLYAYGNWSGNSTVTIDFMLKFHGVTNAVLFAGAGTIMTSMFTPKQADQKSRFPVSELRGEFMIGEDFLKGKITSESSVNGLVDHMDIYQLNLAPTIKDFYENTSDYRLWAKVKWHSWFKPFAAIYKMLSRHTQQINLPLSSKRVEMDGGIHLLKPELDSRNVLGLGLERLKGIQHSLLYIQSTQMVKTPI